MADRFSQPANTIRVNEPACLPNALAEWGRTTLSFTRRVSGRFRIPLRTAPASGPGFTCVYLQTGDRADYAGRQWPVGRVTASASRRFLAGDTVKITAPATELLGQNTQTAITGNASTSGEELYGFLSYSPNACASTAQAEYELAQRYAAEYNEAQYYVTYAVPRGHFGYYQNWPGGQVEPATIYMCAYLQYGTPNVFTPVVGPTLAAGGVPIAISGGIG